MILESISKKPNLVHLFSPPCHLALHLALGQFNLKITWTLFSFPILLFFSLMSNHCYIVTSRVSSIVSHSQSLTHWSDQDLSGARVQSAGEAMLWYKRHCNGWLGRIRQLHTAQSVTQAIAATTHCHCCLRHTHSLPNQSCINYWEAKIWAHHHSPADGLSIACLSRPIRPMGQILVGCK